MKKIKFTLAAILLTVQLFSQVSTAVVKAYWSNRNVPVITNLNSTWDSYWNKVTDGTPVILNGTSVGNVTVTGATNLTGSTTIGTGTVAANTTSLGILRIKQGTSWIDFGHSNSNYGSIWINQTAPTDNNYSIINDGSNLFLNASGSVRAAIGASVKLYLNSSGLRVGSNVSPSAVLDVTGNVLAGTGTVAVNSTTLGIMRIKQGTSFMDFGESQGSFPTIWMQQTTPSTSNYAMAADVNQTYLNGPSSISLGYGNSQRIIVSSTGIKNTLPTKIGDATAPVASAVLELTSTTKGFLPPRMTADQASAIASPAEGLLVYVSNTNGTFLAKGWWGYNGGDWVKLNN